MASYEESGFFKKSVFFSIYFPFGGLYFLVCEAIEYLSADAQSIRDTLEKASLKDDWARHIAEQTVTALHKMHYDLIASKEEPRRAPTEQI